MTSSPPPPARRLHVAAVGAEALDALRQMALPIIAVAVLGGGLDGALLRALSFALLGGVVSVAIAYVSWQTTRWWISGDEVGLRRGVFSESVTTVPLDRVQAIDTVYGPVQRLFGVVELHVQSAGGGRKGEIVLKAVTTDEADELREAVRRGGGAAPAGEAAMEHPEAPELPAPVDGPSVTWRLGRGRLVVAALTSGSFGVLVPVVAGASQIVDDVIGVENAERLVPDSIGEGALLALAVLAAAWLLSVLGTLVAFAGFAAVRDGERLRIRRGIVERREASVPVARVHAVRVVESLLREPFSLATVRIETAGYANEAAQATTLLPLVRRRDVPRLLDELLPELEVGADGELEPVPRSAARRFVLPPVATALVLGAAAAIVVGPPGLLVLLLVAPAAAFGVAAYRAAGWSLTGDRVVLRSRGLARTTATADARRLQAVTISATPFQRRGHLATLGVAVSSGRRFAVEHLDATTADRLRAALGKAATAPPPTPSRDTAAR